MRAQQRTVWKTRKGLLNAQLSKVPILLLPTRMSEAEGCPTTLLEERQAAPKLPTGSYTVSSSEMLTGHKEPRS